MRFRICILSVAWAMLFCSVAMILPGLVALAVGETEQAISFAGSILLSAFISGAAIFSLRGDNSTPSRGEFLLSPVLIFLVLPVFAGLPFLLDGTLNSFTDAYFEAASGLTTTGATIMENLDTTARSLVFWRALMQWLGGIGILTLIIALYPYFELGGMQLFNNALPHGEGEGLLDRVRGVVRSLWWVYGLLTLVCVIFLWIAGVPAFDGLCLGLSTISTGGFMPRSGTLGVYNNPLIEAILLPFMIAGALNFTLHWAALQGRWSVYRRDDEIRRFLMVLGTSASILVLLLVTGAGVGPGLGIFESLRAGLFTAVSMLTTTGFFTGVEFVFPLSPALLIMPIVLLGGTTGSTAGGIKMMRLHVLFRQTDQEIARLSHPHGILRSSYRERQISAPVIAGVWAFFVILILAICGFSLAMGATGLDLHASIATTIAVISNTGPSVVLMDSDLEGYRSVSAVGKWILSMAMIFGRLEVLPIMVLLMPGFWRS